MENFDLNSFVMGVTAGTVGLYFIEILAFNAGRLTAKIIERAETR